MDDKLRQLIEQFVSGEEQGEKNAISYLVYKILQARYGEEATYYVSVTNCYTHIMPFAPDIRHPEYCNVQELLENIYLASSVINRYNETIKRCVQLLNEYSNSN